MKAFKGTRKKISGVRFSVFDVYKIGVRYLSPSERRVFCSFYGLEHVPVLDENFTPTKGESLVPGLLQMAEGPSILAKEREGLVFKANENPAFNFKAISNKWLLKNE